METRQIRDVEHFNHWSTTYESSLGQRFLFDPIHHMVLNLIEDGFTPERILDIGCGTGRLLRKAGARWPAAHLFGGDPAFGMLSVAHRLAPQNIYFQAMAEKLPLEQESFDLILSTVSFHHWRDGAAGIHSVAQALRPGGLFLLADFRPPRWVPGASAHVGPDRTHGPLALREYFNRAGLLVVDQRRVYFHMALVTIGRRPG
jgi:SAM-dependent methyltransferase